MDQTFKGIIKTIKPLGGNIGESQDDFGHVMTSYIQLQRNYQLKKKKKNLIDNLEFIKLKTSTL